VSPGIGVRGTKIRRDPFIGERAQNIGSELGSGAELYLGRVRDRVKHK